MLCEATVLADFVYENPSFVLKAVKHVAIED